MRSRLWSSEHLVSCLAIIFVVACACARDGECEQDPELVELCAAALRAEICFGVPSDDFDFAEHVDGCVCQRQPEAEAVSEACGERHRELMVCLRDENDCYEDAWVSQRLGDGDYVCSGATIAFREACPGVWFSPG